MNDLSMAQTPPLPDSTSPPPKCAICLGVCSNKCFSDSCLHEFCFSCLMEWSKIKAECPLCKKPFKAILHNIKSNDDYEEYVVPDNAPRDFLDVDARDFLFIPTIPSRHFQFRTTFTVDPGGELAIQQMLLSHPLTAASNYNIPHARYRPRYVNSPRYPNSRIRSANSSTAFRSYIYASNFWVAPTEIIGRYRDVSPEFYSNNPAARNRLVPWLNRELNALLSENTQQVMNLVDIIMEHLSRWHIRSRQFRNLLLPFMEDKTDHFLHEFFNFMRSPFDMIGYDRHISYTPQPTTYTFSVSDYDDEEADSDVAIVNVSEPITIDNNPFRQPTIEVIEINSSDSSHDSDVVIGDPSVEVVDLIQSDSDSNIENNVVDERTPVVFKSEDQFDNNNEPSKAFLPVKLRFKRKQLREKSVRKKKKSSRRYSSCDSSCDSSDSSSSSSSSTSHHRSRKRRKYKKSKSRSYKDYKKASKDKYRHKKIESSSSSSSCSSSSTTASSSSASTSSNLLLPKKRKSAAFDSDDNIPLSKIRNKEMRNKSATSHTVTSKTCKNNWNNLSVNNEQLSQPSCSLWQTNVLTSPAVHDNYAYNFPPNSVYDYQFAGFPADSRPSYATYQPATSHFTSPGTSTYQQPHLSYTPPVESNASYFKNEFHYENAYNQDNSRPVCVNVGVGTSPIHSTDDEDEYVGGVRSISNSNARLQRLIVKKEQKNSRPSSDYFLYNSSESN